MIEGINEITKEKIKGIRNESAYASNLKKSCIFTKKIFEVTNNIYLS